MHLRMQRKVFTILLSRNPNAHPGIWTINITNRYLDGSILQSAVTGTLIYLTISRSLFRKASLLKSLAIIIPLLSIKKFAG